MDFKLDPYRRNISEALLLKDLLKVSKQLGTNAVPERKYNSMGHYSSGTFRRRFGSWSIALEKAGLKPKRWDNVPKEIYIEDMKHAALSAGKEALTMAMYDASGKYSSSAIIHKFGSWFTALEAAGLKKTRNLGITRKQFFWNLERVWQSLGRQPIGKDMRKPLSAFSADAYADHFGGWRNALEAFVAWVNLEDSPTTDEDDEPNVSLMPQGETLPQPSGSRWYSHRLRIQVWHRDNHRCVTCGNSPALELGLTLHVDHKVPWSKGGKTELTNLQTLCMRCNLGKGDWTPD